MTIEKAASQSQGAERKPANDNDAPAEPVDGSRLLSDIEAALRRFVWLRDDLSYRIIAAWVLYTYIYDEFDHAPRLAIWSPAPECGKTTLLRVLAYLARKAEIIISPTAPVLFRTIAREHPTLLIDELDKHISGETLRAGLHEVLNEGHIRESSVRRVGNLDDGGAVERFNPFGPVAFAYKNKSVPADLMSRSLPVKLWKARRGEVEKLVSRKHADELRGIAARARAWAAQNRDRLAEIDPKVPSGIGNRSEDNLRPLLAVAEAAGGEWPERIRQAALWLEGQRSQDGELLILTDLKTLLEEQAEQTFFPTTDLLKALTERDEWSWDAWNDGEGLKGTDLAKLLRPFEVRRTTQRFEGEPTKGYKRADLEGAMREMGVLLEVSRVPLRAAA